MTLAMFKLSEVTLVSNDVSNMLKHVKYSDRIEEAAKRNS